MGLSAAPKISCQEDTMAKKKKKTKKVKKPKKGKKVTLESVKAQSDENAGDLARLGELLKSQFGDPFTKAVDEIVNRKQGKA